MIALTVINKVNDFRVPRIEVVLRVAVEVSKAPCYRRVDWTQCLKITLRDEVNTGLRPLPLSNLFHTVSNLSSKLRHGPQVIIQKSKGVV